MRLGPDGLRRATLIGTFAAAVILAIMPFPVWAEPFRPDWVGLVLIYWCLAIPDRVSVGTGWLMGFIQDILFGSLLGSNALAKTLVAFLAVRLQFTVAVRVRRAMYASIGLLLLAINMLAPDAQTLWAKLHGSKVDMRIFTF